MTKTAKANGNAVTFATLEGAVTEKQMKDRAAELGAQFDTRMTFENLHRPGNMSIQTKLAKAKARFASLGMAAHTIAASIDPAFVNRSVSEGKRFNVYAFDKLIDVLTGLGATGRVTNAINVAILKSMIAFEAAGVAFTGAEATAAASDKIKVPAAMNKLLTRHNVGATTAPTQTSSTMNALMIAGIVVNTGMGRAPIYSLTDTPAATRIREVFAAA